MNKHIKYVVVGNKGLTIAIRGDKKAYAKPHGNDQFSADVGVQIATKKLRLKELSSGISQSRANVKAITKMMDSLNADLAKEYTKIGKMLTFRDTVTEELHSILLTLGQD